MQKGGREKRNLISAAAHFLSSFFVVCTVGHQRDSKVRMLGLQGAREAQWGLCHQSAGRIAREALSWYPRIHELPGTGSTGSWVQKEEARKTGIRRWYQRCALKARRRFS